MRRATCCADAGSSARRWAHSAATACWMWAVARVSTSPNCSRWWDPTDGSSAWTPARTMLAVAAERAQRHDNVEFLEADATSLPVANAGFERALCVQVLVYVRDVSAA